MKESRIKPHDAKKEIQFDEITENEVSANYSDGCSGGRSDCCTRVCTRVGQVASEEEWGKFLAVEGGVIQY